MEKEVKPQQDHDKILVKLKDHFVIYWRKNGKLFYKAAPRPTPPTKELWKNK
jgi:hypothetical protein